ncbi:hypothetical protein FGIG_06769 [Fasciola gigantica]|uniref:Transmembrane protein n=1 Tax=Fasciola gigantica TaxID=46835 RepID=A0A504YH64_FASGI|nr:hypothetical protein FGIG_06769 [Fasciola gigantica]
MQQYQNFGPALLSIFWCLLLSNGWTALCSPLMDLPELVTAADLATGAARATSYQLEKSEAKATRQVAFAKLLEDAAQRAAFKARALQEKAREAKFRAYEAVAEEQAIADRERQIETAARQRQQSVNSFHDLSVGTDALMEKDPSIVHKRSSFVHGFVGQSTLDDSEDADPLEALRILYLQRLLAGQERPKSKVPTLIDSPDRLVLVPPRGIWLERALETEKENHLSPFGELLSSEYPYSSDNRVTLPERILTSSVINDGEVDENDHLVV